MNKKPYLSPERLLGSRMGASKLISHVQFTGKNLGAGTREM